MSKYINVAVVGATGYIGLELIKLLIKHPKVKIKNICAQMAPIIDLVVNRDKFQRILVW